MANAPPFTWPGDRASLAAAQDTLACASPPPWSLPDGPFLVAGCALVSTRGAAGAGGSGDPGWAAAVLLEVGAGPPREVAAADATGALGAAFETGVLALREGPLLHAAVAALPRAPDVLVVHAAGRDHPRRAGLALMLGAATGLPSIGVTTRPLVARAPDVADRPPHPGPLPRWGNDACVLEPLVLDGAIVAYRVRTRAGLRPVVAHAGWRTTAELAAALALGTTANARTPEPIRRALERARRLRARA
ncbi:endonuclease V [Anaeromyxobacter oryzae]|nr:endonuclease V [Anaeromyxobacter oryzae]